MYTYLYLYPKYLFVFYTSSVNTYTLDRFILDFNNFPIFILSRRQASNTCIPRTHFELTLMS